MAFKWYIWSIAWKGYKNYDFIFWTTIVIVTHFLPSSLGSRHYQIAEDNDGIAISSGMEEMTILKFQSTSGFNRLRQHFNFLRVGNHYMCYGRSK
jgi:hypothetical protein